MVGQQGRDRAWDGFTLVEVVMVVVLVAIVAGIAIPAVNVSRFRTDAAALEIATTLQAAQRLSVLRGHNITLAFDLEGQRVRVHLDANNDGVVQPGEEVRWVRLGDGVVFGRGGAPALGSRDRPVSFDQKQGGMPALTFRRNGSASQEGVIYVTSGRSESTGAYPEESRAVEVVRATGRITCWRFGAESWTEGC